MTVDWVGPLAAARQIRIETRRRSGQGTHEVPVWFALVDGEVAVLARSAGSDWVRNIRAEPAVTVRARRRRWAGVARIVTDLTESQAVQRTWLDRYATQLARYGRLDWDPETTVVAITRAAATE